MHSPNKKYSIIITGSLLSIVFIAVSICIGLVWETNDDPSIAYLLTYQNNDYSPFQWRLLSIILHNLYLYVPIIDWWAFNNVFAVWMGTFALTYIIFRRYPGFHAGAITGIVYIAIWILAASVMNFTRTASIVSVGGVFLIADSIMGRPKPARIQYVLGCFLMLYGASIRANCAYISLAFMYTACGVLFLSDNFSFRISWFKSHKRQIFSLITAGLILLCSAILDHTLLTDEQKTYLAYNSFRSNIQDYYGMYPSFEDAKTDYLEAGFDQYDLNMFQSLFSEETEIMTADSLEKVSLLKQNPTDLFPLHQACWEARNALYILCILLFILALRKRHNVFLFLPILLLMALLCLLLNFSARIPTRVLAALILSVIGAVTFVSSDPSSQNQVSAHTENKGHILTGIYWLCTIALLLSVSDNIYNKYKTVEKPWASNEQYVQRRANSSDIINNTPENLYFFEVFKDVSSISNAFSFWEPKPTGYCENYYLLGGWSARHPYKVARMEEHRITNPMRALYEKTNVYSTYNPQLLEYLTVKYNEVITVSEIMRINGVPIVQYTALIEDPLLASSNASVPVHMTEFHAADHPQEHVWYFSAEISQPIEEDTPIYCNLTVNQQRRTYRLATDGSHLSAYFYKLDPTFSLQDANPLIFTVENEQYNIYPTNFSQCS